jgi:hypothetical protein
MILNLGLRHLLERSDEVERLLAELKTQREELGGPRDTMGT